MRRRQRKKNSKKIMINLPVKDLVKPSQFPSPDSAYENRAKGPRVTLEDVAKATEQALEQEAQQDS